METDRLRVVEHDAFRRHADAVPHRLLRMAHGAARDHDILNLREGRRRRLRLGRIRRARAEAREPGDQQEADRRDGPCPPRRLAAGVLLVEEVPDREAHDHDERDDEPVEPRRERQRVMVRDHQEDDGQRQVVVVQRALLAGLAEGRVGRLAREQRLHDLALLGDDDVRDIRHHHGADERAELDKGAAAAEDLRQPPGDENQIDEEHREERHVVLAERRLAEQVVDDPADRQGEHAERHRLPRGEVEHRAIDEIELRVRPVVHAQKREAGEEGRIRLPFEPGEVLRHVARRDHVFLHVVEAAAVHLPGLAADTFGQAGALLQGQVEMHEIEGRADPGDSRDHVQPADGEITPFAGEYLPRHVLLHPLSRRSGRVGARSGPDRAAAMSENGLVVTSPPSVSGVVRLTPPRRPPPSRARRALRPRCRAR